MIGCAALASTLQPLLGRLRPPLPMISRCRPCIEPSALSQWQLYRALSGAREGCPPDGACVAPPPCVAGDQHTLSDSEIATPAPQAAPAGVCVRQATRGGGFRRAASRGGRTAGPGGGAPRVGALHQHHAPDVRGGARGRAGPADDAPAQGAEVPFCLQNCCMLRSTRLVCKHTAWPRRRLRRLLSLVAAWPQ